MGKDIEYISKPGINDACQRCCTSEEKEKGKHLSVFNWKGEGHFAFISSLFQTMSLCHRY
jgi:hypothetical protein